MKKEPWHLYPLATVFVLYVVIDLPEWIKGLGLFGFIVIQYIFSSYIARKKLNRQ